LFAFLPHGSPNVGVHIIDARNGFGRIAHNGEPAAFLPCGFKDSRVRIIPFRNGKHKFKREVGGRLDQGCSNVVPVPDPRYTHLGQVGRALINGQYIGQNLAGMPLIGQGVDHRDGTVTLQFVKAHVPCHAEVRNARADFPPAS